MMLCCTTLYANSSQFTHWEFVQLITHAGCAVRAYTIHHMMLLITAVLARSLNQDVPLEILDIPLEILGNTKTYRWKNLNQDVPLEGAIIAHIFEHLYGNKRRVLCALVPYHGIL